jgi:hypothetical protein
MKTLNQETEEIVILCHLPMVQVLTSVTNAYTLKHSYQKITSDNGVCREMFIHLKFSFFPYCKCAYVLHGHSVSKTACPLQSVLNSISECCTLFCFPYLIINMIINAD